MAKLADFSHRSVMCLDVVLDRSTKFEVHEGLLQTIDCSRYTIVIEAGSVTSLVDQISGVAEALSAAANQLLEEAASDGD